MCTTAIGGVGAEPPATNGFSRFSHIKTLILADFFKEKGHGKRTAAKAIAVTVKTAKTF